MENLDPASIHAQQVIVSEIFRSAECERALTLGHVLKVYDATIAKHGISATDLAGIQIYRALLQWGRQDTSKPRQTRTPLEPVVGLNVGTWNYCSTPAQEANQAAPDDSIPIPDLSIVPRGPETLGFGVRGPCGDVVSPAVPSSPKPCQSSSPTIPQLSDFTPVGHQQAADVQDIGQATVHESLETTAAEPVVISLAETNHRAPSPGLDFLDELLPTASALVSTSMLPFPTAQEETTIVASQGAGGPGAGEAGARSDFGDMAILADAFAYRKGLARAIGAWQSAVQQEHRLARELQRKQALRRWHQKTASDVSERAADLQRAATRRRRSLERGLEQWQLTLTARRRFRAGWSQLQGLQRRRCMNFAFCCWRLPVQSAKQRLAQAMLRARHRVLQACWSGLRGYAEQQQLMTLYRSRADVHWLRSRLGAAWQAWLQWFRKRGKVVAMCSAPQLLAAWRWLRVHASRSGHLGPRPSSSGHAQAAQGRAWWWVPAVELFFGTASFDIHPHHIKAVQHSVLPGFVSALMKKMLAAWQMQALATLKLTNRVKLRILGDYLSAWQVGAERKKQIRVCREQVIARRAGRARAFALKSWRTRCQQKARHRRRARDFAASCWQRSCTRAFLAWRMVWRWEAAVLEAQYLAGRRRLCETMKAWIGQWHYDRQESVLQRLSGLFLRKCSLKRGLRRLCVHVTVQARRRGVLEAEARLRQELAQRRRRLMEACWVAWRGHAESCKLMRLYRSWADVHWLRSRLDAAWQAWKKWFHKRGKVVAMCSAPQLLAAWRWLRVHAARSGHLGRRLLLPAVAAPWQPAADLLFGLAPFDAHPHHVQAVHARVVQMFAHALLKKMIDGWLVEVLQIRGIMQGRAWRFAGRLLSAWKAAAAKCRRLRASEHRVRREAQRRALQKVRDGAILARRQRLEVCWAKLLKHTEQQRLMKLYQSSADVQRLRAMLAAAWQAWIKWWRKRGKVVAMCSAPQLLAAWRWLRVHAARSGHLGRRLLLPAVAAPWQPAADLLFGLAPFDAHPHHMQVVHSSLLVMFASALLKKMLLCWSAQVHEIHDLSQQARDRALQRCIRTWKARSQFRRRRRHLESAVATAQQRSSELFAEWKLSCGAQILAGWAEAARSLAVQETRRILQADDIRRRSRRKALTGILNEWRAEIQLRREAANAARMRKVLASWHLAVQEQALLQKYLQECASVTLQGVERAPQPSVGPSDLEQVYREMAELRWDADVEAGEELLSD